MPQQVLVLSGNRINSLSGLPPLTSLKSLQLDYNALTSLEGLGRLPGLEALHCEGNELTDCTGRLQRLPQCVVRAAVAAGLGGSLIVRPPRVSPTVSQFESRVPCRPGGLPQAEGAAPGAQQAGKPQGPSTSFLASFLAPMSKLPTAPKLTCRRPGRLPESQGAAPGLQQADQPQGPARQVPAAGGSGAGGQPADQPGGPASLHHELGGERFSHLIFFLHALIECRVARNTLGALPLSCCMCMHPW